MVPHLLWRRECRALLAGDIDAAPRARKRRSTSGTSRRARPRPAGTWVAARTESTREIMHDQVAQTRLYRFWNTAPDGSRDAELLSIVGQILGGGKTSRLYERLVYRERIADTVSAGLSGFEIAGLFASRPTSRPACRTRRVEAAIAEELERFIARGPTDAEVARARTSIRAGFVKGLERIGGFGGKADVLAACEVFEGDPDCYRRSLRIVDTATPDQLREAAQRWLARGDYTLEVHPVRGSATRSECSGPDAGRAGDPSGSRTSCFPNCKRHRLGNGLASHHRAAPGTPVARVSLLFDAGYAADQWPQPPQPRASSWGCSTRHPYARVTADRGPGPVDRRATSRPARRSTRRSAPCPRCRIGSTSRSSCSRTCCATDVPAMRSSACARSGSRA